MRKPLKPAAGAFGLLFALSVLTASSVKGWQEPSAYLAQAVFDGQVHRLLSHLWVHTSTAHAALNLAGLGALLWLWPANVRVSRYWFAVVVLSLMACLCFVPGPVWGLSGPLHALFAFNALALGFRDAQGLSRFRGVLTAGLLVKLCAEAFGWCDTDGIAWQAHWAGAAAGWLGAALSYVLSYVRSYVRSCAASSAQRPRSLLDVPTPR